METHYNNLNHKLDKLQNMQNSKNKTQHNPPRTTILPSNSKFNKNQIYQKGNGFVEPWITMQHRKAIKNIFDQPNN